MKRENNGWWLALQGVAMVASILLTFGIEAWLCWKGGIRQRRWGQ